MVDEWDDWPVELQDFWENTTGVYQGYMSRDEMLEFVEESGELFMRGWGHDTEDSETRQQARDEFFALMAEYELDAALFDWNDWRDWYESA